MGAAALGAEAAGAACGPGSGALCTEVTGADLGAGGGPSGCGFGGGALAAASEALAPAGWPAAVPGGGGGGAVPMPNRLGEAVREDGSANGAASAARWAWARSATRPAVSASNCLRSGGVGRSGTLARLGYGSSAPGGGGRRLAISPPSRLCHQFTGFIERNPEEQPASSSAATKGKPA